MIPPAPDAPLNQPPHGPQAQFLAMVQMGCPPVDAPFAAQLPTWLMDKSFAADFRKAVTVSQRNGHCSPVEADRRLRAYFDREIDETR